MKLNLKDLQFSNFAYPPFLGVLHEFLIRITVAKEHINTPRFRQECNEKPTLGYAITLTDQHFETHCCHASGCLLVAVTSTTVLVRAPNSLSPYTLDCQRSIKV